MITKSQQEINNCIQNQEYYCKNHKLPNFSPIDGICYRCHKNIYQNYIINGKTLLGEDGNEFITGCPYCGYSFCD